MASRSKQSYTIYMATRPLHSTTSAFIERLDGELIVASFWWAQPNTKDSYNLSPARGLDLNLDQHYPLRPNGLTVNYNDSGNAELVESVFGAEFTKAVQFAQRFGMLVTPLCLSSENRLQLAKLQLADPSLNPHLQQACQQILESSEQINPSDASVVEG